MQAKKAVLSAWRAVVTWWREVINTDLFPGWVVVKQAYYERLTKAFDELVQQRRNVNQGLCYVTGRLTATEQTLERLLKMQGLSRRAINKELRALITTLQQINDRTDDWVTTTGQPLQSMVELNKLNPRGNQP